HQSPPTCAGAAARLSRQYWHGERQRTSNPNGASAIVSLATCRITFELTPTAEAGGVAGRGLNG
ncbi:MAG: hypothetical protein ACKO15_09035, partial [Burkholderiales bacterium]